MTQHSHIVPVILCGGMGSRLWPLSRKQHPKQFLSLDDDNISMLQHTIMRVADQGFLPPVIVTNEAHRFLVAQHLQDIGSSADIILEPTGRNTAPAITAAALFIQEKYNDAVMLVLPSDHVIHDTDAFIAAVTIAGQAADNDHLVTFGITPSYAETGYGYINKGCALPSSEAYNVACFVEKPDAPTAQAYLDNGNYLWNSGMFMFKAAQLLYAMEQFQPLIVRCVCTALARGQHDPYFIHLDTNSFTAAPDISIDYAVMEPTDNAAVVPVECGWNDAGAWDALWRIANKDDNDNVIHGDVITHDSEGCYLRADRGPAIATVGLKDIVVVTTSDMVLVADKHAAQDVKTIMETAKATKGEWVEHHTRVQRPWGYYESIQTGERHQVKHIMVNPGARLSVQMHHHRAEHWVMVSGTAKVLVGETEYILTDNDHVHIPLGEVHCIENIGKIPLYFVEVQHGSYLGEDDIVRFEDRYGRAGVASKGKQPYKPTLVEKENIVKL